MKALEPYLNREERDVRLEGLQVSSRESDWIADRLREVYAKGVISLQNRQELERLGVNRAVMLDGNSVVGKVDVCSLFTPKTAYDYIVDRAKSVVWIDNNVLQTVTLGDYITPNVEIDRRKTDDAMQIIVEGVMLTSGMVQKGEKIIDKGEVISEEKYQILKSLQRAVEGEEEFEQNGNVWNVVGDLLIISILYSLLFVYLLFFRRKILESIRATVFMFLMTVGMLGLLALVTQYLCFYRS